MKTDVLVMAVALLVPGVCFPQVRPRPPQQQTAPPTYLQQLKSFDQDGPVTKVVLKNNLTVLVAEAHANPLVEVLTWVKTGYGDDPSDLGGAARVMEHMLTRGTTNRTAAVVASDMKALGGETHSATEFDHTVFRTTAPAPQWKKLLEIQADVLLNPLLDAQELKRQIDAVADEAQRKLESPGSLLEARLLETGLAGEQMKHGSTVSKEALNRITRDKLLAFHRSAYTPDRMILVICGDVVAGDVLNAAVNLFAGAKAGGAVQSHGGGGTGFYYAQVRGSGALARLNLSFRTVPAGSSDYLTVEVLRAVIGTGESSVINRRLKNQKGLIFGSESKLFASDVNGYLTLQMDLDSKDIDKCEIAAFTEFEILKKQADDNGELARARAQLKREFWETMQTVSGRAERLARLESLGSWKGINTYLARLGQVKWADVTRAAARILTIENCAAIEYLPETSEPRTATAEAVQNTLRGLLEPSAQQESAEREKATVAALNIPEESGSFAPSPVRSPFQKASILRGPELFIREDHTMPVIHVGFFFAGGKLKEAKENAGITSLMLRSMLRDTKTTSADQLYRQLEVYGGLLTPVVEDDYYGVYLSILSANVESGLDLLTEMVKNPKFDPQEIARQKVLQIAALRRRCSGEIAHGQLLAALFPDYSYGLDADGSEQSIAGITAEAVQAWYKLNVEDRRPMVVIVGDTQGSSLAGYFVQHFSGSRFEDVTLPEGFPKPLAKKSAVEAHGSGSASLVMVGFQAPPEEDEDSFPMIVFQSYASGLAGRLTTPIQDRIPSARNVAVSYDPQLRGGSVTISMSVAPADEELSLKVITEELQRTITAQLPYRDYRSAVNATTGGLMIARQALDCQIADMMKSALAGKGVEGFQEYGNRLQDVKQPDLQDVAERILKMDKAITLRIHGKSPLP